MADTKRAEQKPGTTQPPRTEWVLVAAGGNMALDTELGRYPSRAALLTTAARLSGALVCWAERDGRLVEGTWAELPVADAVENRARLLADAGYRVERTDGLPLTDYDFAAIGALLRGWLEQQDPVLDRDHHGMAEETEI